jgi:hypothetical protein
MPNSGSSTVKKNARRVQDAFGIKYTVALRTLEAAKAENDHLTWTQTADLVIAEAAK